MVEAHYVLWIYSTHKHMQNEVQTHMHSVEEESCKQKGGGMKCIATTINVRTYHTHYIFTDVSPNSSD